MIIIKKDDKTRVIAMNLKNGLIKHKKRLDNFNRVHIMRNYEYYTINDLFDVIITQFAIKIDQFTFNLCLF